MGRQGGEDSWQGSGWWSGRSHICKQINWNNCGVTQTTQPRVPVQEKRASKPLAINTYGIAAAGETPSLTEEFV